MKQCLHCGFFCLFAAVLAHGQERTIQFSQPEYTTFPGTTLRLETGLDQAIGSGLFSFGLKLTYESDLGQISDEQDIFLPASLDFGGPLGPAFRTAGPGFAAAKGTVNIFLDPPQNYHGSSLVIFDLTFPRTGEYTVQLGLFQSLGETEQIFLSGAGEVLDDQLQFGSAKINVVPEPGTAPLLIFSGLTALFLRHSRNERF